MVKDYNRTDRINQLLQREIAELLQLEMKDPRLGWVTVNAVQVTRDLSYAKVYITILGDEAKNKEGVKILNHAAAYLRTSLAKRKIKIRALPQLIFVYDSSVSEGARLSALIDGLEETPLPPQDEES